MNLETSEEKADLVKLDTSIYRDWMKDSWHKLDTSRSIELYDFRILRSEFWPMMTWIARVSFTKPLARPYKSFILKLSNTQRFN